MSQKLHAAFLPALALIVLLAIPAASASAYPAYPEYKRCVKAEKVGKEYIGEYAENECKTKASPAKTGKYELDDWKEGDAWEFTTKSKTSALATKSTTGVAENVVCKKDTASGEVVIAGYYTEEHLILEGCRANGSKTQPCENAGTEKIETAPLIGLLVYLPGEAVIGERLNFAEEHGPFAAFHCGAEAVEVRGEVIGSIENTSKGQNISFSVAAGAQEDMFAEFEGNKEGPFHLVTGGLGGEEATLQTVEERKQKGVGVY